MGPADPLRPTQTHSDLLWDQQTRSDPLRPAQTHSDPLWDQQTRSDLLRPAVGPADPLRPTLGPADPLRPAVGPAASLTWFVCGGSRPHIPEDRPLSLQLLIAGD